MKKFDFGDFIMNCILGVMAVGLILLLIVVVGNIINHKSDKQILCDDPLIVSPEFEIVSRGCISFGSSTTGLLSIKDKNTGKETFYTVSRISGEIVFNLTTPEAVGINRSNNASMMAGASLGMATAAMARGR